MNEMLFKVDNKRPYDLIVMGRVAVDLYSEQIGLSLANADSFRKYLGGCAGNIAVGTARLGLKSRMFSCVGADEMGRFLKETLLKEQVNIDLLKESAKHLTGLVLLGIDPPNHFPLMFYRNDCADMQIRVEDITAADLAQAKALVITGTGLSTPAMRETSYAVVALAQRCQTKVIFDLDYRPVLWGLTPVGDGENRYINDQQVSAVYQSILASCDLLVGTEEEVCIAGGAATLDAALSNLRQFTQAPVVVKSGEKGCRVFLAFKEEPLVAKPFHVQVQNVLGAGDGFMAGLLRGLLREATWEQAMIYANACGAIVVSRHGCSVAIPYWDELQQFLKDYGVNPTSAIKTEQRILVNKADTLLKQAGPFKTGLTCLVDKNQSLVKTEMNFSVLKLSPGESFSFNSDYEFAALLMTGRVQFQYDQCSYLAERADYFSQPPIVLHCPAGLAAQVKALSFCEILLIETENKQDFLPLVFDKTNMLEIDHRGQGILENTSYRLVRTVFDKRNRPESNLVVGEIITFQGRWSSYPSHHHPQPEIYHYRFSEPQGYAFGEMGKEVLRIEHQDTYLIPAGYEHAHSVAPGYALYTLWFIRHLQDNPYISPVFCDEHAWTKQVDAKLRAWQ